MATYFYSQSTGQIQRSEGGLIEHIGVGYSGNGQWKNDPESQNVPMHGPIPQGDYTASLIDEEKGPVTIHLTPNPANEMFGRFGFLWHGDNAAHPGESSEGCIVSGLVLRQTVRVGDRICVGA